MPSKRDPVSELFDDQARRLLLRAGAQRGEWTRTRLPDPGLRTRTWAAGRGFPGNLTGPDNASVHRKPKIDARTAWARSFIRAVQYWHKKDGARARLQIEVGRHLGASPQYNPADPGAGGIPPGRVIRIKIGGVPDVSQVPASKRIYDEDGTPGPLHSDPGLRWWNAG